MRTKQLRIERSSRTVAPGFFARCRGRATAGKTKTPSHSLEPAMSKRKGRLFSFGVIVFFFLSLWIPSPRARAQSGSGTSSNTQAMKGTEGSGEKLEAERRNTSDAKEPATNPAKVTENAVPDRDYVIGVQDVLNIDVWREPEITRAVTVRPDGKISLPLIGELDANGLTTDVLQAEIAKGLANYFRDPQVTVIIQEANSHKFNVIGSVQHAGVFPLVANIGVLDAIAVAGGFRDFAKVNGIYVLRRMPDGSRKRLTFNYKAAVQGKPGYRDTVLQTGDTVVVP
jgi:polysaccharide export outer membrane protein